MFHNNIYALHVVGHHLFNEHSRVEYRMHPSYSLHYFTHGKGTYVLNNRATEVQPGEVCFFQPGMTFEWASTAEAPLGFFHIRYDIAQARHNKQDWEFTPKPHQPIPYSGVYSVAQQQSEFFQAFQTLHHLFQNVDDRVKARCTLKFHELMLTLDQVLSNQHTSDSNRSILEAVLSYVHDHYQLPLTLEMLADQAGWSTSHFVKMFRQYTGHSPKDYIIQVRINRAKSLLEFQHLKIKDVAKSVGYHDEFYFSRIFKKITGYTPSEYAAKVTDKKE